MKKGLEVSELEKTLDRIQEWIRSADQKISIFLAFEGIIVTLIAFPLLSWAKQIILQFDLPILLLLYLSSFLLLYGLVKMIYAISPVLKLKEQPGNSFTYFKDIAKLKIDEYRKLVDNVSNSDYKNELTNQIFASSRIANQKHTQFKDSLILFFLGFFFLLITSLFFIHKYGI